jgi:transcription elongation GreA/GreB family factor
MNGRFITSAAALYGYARTPVKPIDKRRLIEALRAQIGAEIAAATKAAKDAAHAATHEEARPENDKDTRGLEASYLARGQADRVRDLEMRDNLLQFLPLRDAGDGEAIAAGMLVELELPEGRVVYFLAPAGGGMKATVDGVDILVVTPEAPVGGALLGKQAGDVVELRLRGAVRECEIVHIQ